MSSFSRTFYRVMATATPRNQRKRMIQRLNKLFYECSPLTGEELHSLTNGRRLQFAQDDTLQLIMYPDTWQVEKRTWDGMADILNTWSVGDQIREKVKGFEKDKLVVIDLVVEDYDSNYDERDLLP